MKITTRRKSRLRGLQQGRGRGRGCGDQKRHVECLHFYQGSALSNGTIESVASREDTESGNEETEEWLAQRPGTMTNVFLEVTKKNSTEKGEARG